MAAKAAKFGPVGGIPAAQDTGYTPMRGILVFENRGPQSPIQGGFLTDTSYAFFGVEVVRNLALRHNFAGCML